jgi:hypothetical protein
MATLNQESRWPSILSFIAVGSLYLALPPALTPGPNWLLLVILAGLLVPAIHLHHTGQHRANEYLGFLLSGLITMALLWSLGALIAGLPAHRESRARYGRQMYWCSPPGTGDSMPAVLVNETCGAATPKDRSYSRK